MDVAFRKLGGGEDMTAWRIEDPPDLHR